MIFKIEKNVENPGGAVDMLHGVVRSITNGLKKGEGWILGEGELEQKESNRAQILNPQLQDLSSQLMILIVDEDINDHETGKKLEKLLPMLCDALEAEGYGVRMAPETSQNGAGSIVTLEDGESVVEGQKTPENAPQEVTEGVQKVENGDVPPWEKK